MSGTSEVPVGEPPAPHENGKKRKAADSATSTPKKKKNKIKSEPEQDSQATINGDYDTTERIEVPDTISPEDALGHLNVHNPDTVNGELPTHPSSL